MIVVSFVHTAHEYLTNLPQGHSLVESHAVLLEADVAAQTVHDLQHCLVESQSAMGVSLL